MNPQDLFGYMLNQHEPPVTNQYYSNPLISFCFTYAGRPVSQKQYQENLHIQLSLPSPAECLATFKKVTRQTPAGMFRTIHVSETGFDY
jgi:hypothetical protein